MSKKLSRYQLVLFDLDGTLADTARDMILALNLLLKNKSKETVSYDELRCHVSNGTPALIGIGFNLTPDDADYEELKDEFLAIYKSVISLETELFPGMQELLDDLVQAGVTWGIVTNKPEYLTVELVEKLGLMESVGCIVGGDTLPYRKPSPIPILHACELVEVAPSQSVYIGDSSRDIESAKGAGLKSIGVTYGYIVPGDDPYQWGADHVVESVSEIAQHIWLPQLQHAE